MIGPGPADVVAVVVTGGDAAALARSLASVSWARERVVWDPGDRVGAGTLPAGVRHVRRRADVEASSAATWILLVAEEEVASDALAAAVADATRSTPSRAYRVPLRIRVGDHALEVLAPPVRLAPRGARPSVRSDGTLTLVGAMAAGGRVAAHLLVAQPEAPESLTMWIESRSRVRAELLATDRVRPRLLRLVRSGLLSAARVLFGRATAAMGWERWLCAVVAGYAALVAEARLWERGFAEDHDTA